MKNTIIPIIRDSEGQVKAGTESCGKQIETQESQASFLTNTQR